MDTEVTDHLLTTTRMVRKRLDLDRPVDTAVVVECIGLSMQAPTASNGQGWRWMIVTDAAKRKRLAELYNEVGAAYLKMARDAVTDAQTKRVYDSAVYLTDVLERVPVHVIPCIEGRIDDAPNAIAAASYGSILPAAWSFILALRSRGLGSCWTTLHLFKEQETAELLGIPEGFTQVALLPVAHTTGGDFKPATRPDPATISFVDEWGNSPS
jgi:nitroreductase